MYKNIYMYMYVSMPVGLHGPTSDKFLIVPTKFRKSIIGGGGGGWPLLPPATLVGYLVRTREIDTRVLSRAGKLGPLNIAFDIKQLSREITLIIVYHRSYIICNGMVIES